MKKAIFLFILFFISNGKISFSQANLKNNYSITLPKEWEKKPKLLFKLTDIIRTSIPILENRKECVDCNADYYVRFYISAPSLKYVFYHPTSNYEFTSIFCFYSYMDVSDSSGVIVHRLILNDTLITHSFKYKLNDRKNVIPPVQGSIAQLKANILPPLQNGQRQMEINLGDHIENISALIQQFDSDQFIKTNTKLLTPTESLLWSKVQDIIMSFKFEDNK